MSSTRLVRAKAGGQTRVPAAGGFAEMSLVEGPKPLTKPSSSPALGVADASIATSRRLPRAVGFSRASRPWLELWLTGMCGISRGGAVEECYRMRQDTLQVDIQPGFPTSVAHWRRHRAREDAPSEFWTAPCP